MSHVKKFVVLKLQVKHQKTARDRIIIYCIVREVFKVIVEEKKDLVCNTIEKVWTSKVKKK
jgi:hypothetical protein